MRAAILSLFLLGLLGATAAPASAASKPQAGVWEGATADGTRVAFDVDSRGVSNVILGLRCGASAVPAVGPFTESLRVRRGAFEKRWSRGKEGRFGLRARFTSQTRATGVVLADSACTPGGSFTARRLNAPVLPRPAVWSGTDSVGGTVSFTVTDRWHGGRVVAPTMRYVHSFRSDGSRLCLPAGVVGSAFAMSDVHVPLDRLGRLTAEERVFDWIGPVGTSSLTVTFTGDTARGTWRIARPVEGVLCDSGTITWQASAG